MYNTGKGNSTFFGFGAGLNDDGNNNNNTFVGYNAGLNNTTGFITHSLEEMQDKTTQQVLTTHSLD